MLYAVPLMQNAITTIHITIPKTNNKLLTLPVISIPAFLITAKLLFPISVVVLTLQKEYYFELCPYFWTLIGITKENNKKICHYSILLFRCCIFQFNVYNWVHD